MKRLSIGVRTCLYGAHCLFVHPFFVYRAWVILYGPVRDPRLLAAFFVHDLGYLTGNIPNIDGPEGERHVEWGVEVMARMFGAPWGTFTAHHSRFYCALVGQPFSRLCPVDKLAPTLESRGFFLARIIATGEIWEYLEHATTGKYLADHKGAQALDLSSAEIAARRLTPRTWRAILAWNDLTITFLRDWAWAHRDEAVPEPPLPCSRQAV